MLKLVENIEFIKNRKLKVNKIDEKEFILENKNEKYILNLFPFGKFSKISKIFDCLNKLSEEFSNISYGDIGILNDKFCYRIIPFVIDEKNNLTDEEAYNVGFEIGKFVFEYHKSFQGCDCGRWNKHYNYRINKKREELKLERKEFEGLYTPYTLTRSYKLQILKFQMKENVNKDNIDRLVIKEKVSVKDKIKEMFKFLSKITKFIFNTMFLNKNKSKDEIISAFLGILEMAKKNEIKIKQENIFSDILVEKSNEK